MNVLTQLNGLLPTSGGSMADLNSYMLLQSGVLDTIGLLIIPAAVIIFCRHRRLLGLPV